MPMPFRPLGARRFGDVEMGRRGPRPEPVELRILRGNPSRRPIPAHLKLLPPPEPPSCPAFLDDYARQEWNHVAPGLHAMPLLTAADVS